MNARRAKHSDATSETVGASQQSLTALPSGWVWSCLGDICRTTSGGTPSRKHASYFAGNIPWVKSGELPDGVVTDVEECITEEAVKNSSAKLFPAGTLLIALYGATVGKLGILKYTATTNQAICAIFPPDHLDTKYLFWYLRCARSDLVAQAVGGAQPNISQGILRTLPIPVSPLDQQKHIVAEIEKQFSRLDEAVANLKRVKANLKRYKAAVLKAAVEGRLVETEAELARRECRSYETGAQLLQRILETRRSQWKGKGKYKEPAAPDTTDLPELPEGWVWASAEQVCGSVRDGTHDTPAYVDIGVPLITSKNLTDQGIDFENVQFISVRDYAEISRRSGVESGDVLFAMIGTVGNPCEIKTDALFSIKNVGLFKRKPETLNSTYLCDWLDSPPLKKWLEPRLKGTTQKFAPLGLLREIPVPYFPLSEQNRIVAEVDRRLSVAREVEAQVDTNMQRADRLRQLILSRAFSGQLVEIGTAISLGIQPELIIQ